jgi:hypothetical protein
MTVKGIPHFSKAPKLQHEGTWVRYHPLVAKMNLLNGWKQGDVTYYNLLSRVVFSSVIVGEKYEGCSFHCYHFFVFNYHRIFMSSLFFYRDQSLKHLYISSLDTYAQDDRWPTWFLNCIAQEPLNLLLELLRISSLDFT